MGSARLKNIARTAAILVAVTALAPDAASADEHIVRRAAPPGVYSAPITPIYSYLGTNPYQPWTPWDYTFPILATYQFPAVIADQPGADVGYLRTNRAAGRLGGRPYLYHP